MLREVRGRGRRGRGPPRTCIELVSTQLGSKLGADQLDARPWRPSPAPPTAADLTQYALWRASDLTPEDLLSALSLVPAAKAEIEGVETGLLFVARSAGLTWAQIADAMGFRSPQACQQYVNRLTARQDKRQ